VTLKRLTITTPWSPLTVIVDSDDVVVASWFGRKRGTDASHLDLEGIRDVRTHPVAQSVAAWVHGDVDAILAVNVRQPGGEFQQAAWNAMRDVPGGTVVSYAELAHMAGRPRAIRAAGTACARNNVAPFVPCHRIVRTDGTMGAYGFGVRLKEQLLEHEGVLLAD